MKSVSTKLPWEKLKPSIHLHDIPYVQLSPEEIETIDTFCDKFFSQEVLQKGRWLYPEARGRNINPNARGIRGELAVLRHFAPHLSDITSFLTDRPWKMRDMGDSIIIGNTAKIFDTKTRARKVLPPTLIADDTYMAELDAKFLDENRYGYLQCFIFCASNIARNQVYLMGWMSLEEFRKYGEMYKAGREVPHAGMTYSSDFLCIPYRRLHPITQLTNLEYYPITAEMTYTMRDDYDKKHIRPIDGKKYISAFSL